MLDWTAVILAAGRGTRLRPHTTNRPKPLVEIDGLPLLGILLERCRDAGAQSAVVVVGDRAPQLRRWLARACPLPHRAVEAPHHATRGNGWSLHAAVDALETPWCVKLDGDLLLSPAVLPPLLDGPTAPRLLYDPRAELDEEAMKVRCAGGWVTALGKGLPGGDGESIGVELLDAESLRLVADAIEAAPLDAYYEDAYQRCVERGWRLEATPVRGAWLEIDDPDDLARARADWAAGALA